MSAARRHRSDPSGSRVRARALLAATCVSLAAVSCATVDGRLRLRGMEVEGNEGVSDREILDRLALVAEDGYAWSDERYLDEVLFERDAPRVARIYRAFGYYHARLDAVGLRWTPDGSGVVLTFHVTEGAPAVLETLTVTGLDRLPPVARREAQDAIRVAEGEVIAEDDWDATKEGVRRALRNNGFPSPTVAGTVRIDDDADTAAAELVIDAGPLADFGEVRISGLESVPEPPIRGEIGIEPGETFSAARLDDARAALVNAGIFSSIEVTEVPLESAEPPSAGAGSGAGGVPGESAALPAVDIGVELAEGDMQRLKVGVGFATEQGRQQAEVTGTYEHRNLFGGLRRLQWKNRFGWAFDLGAIDTAGGRVDLGPFGSTVLNFRQPDESDLRLAVLASLKYEAEPTASDYSTQAIQARVGAERTFRDRTLSMGLFNGLRWVDLWNVQAGASVADVPYLLYLLDFTTTLDLRDDPLAPHDGHYVSALLRLGIDPTGGEYQDGDDARDFYRYFLLQGDLRGYYGLHERVTLVLRVAAGIIVPFGGAALAPPDERFFSGGANSVRGLPYNAVGAWRGCPEDPPDPACVQPPLGGNTQWEMSAELRVRVWGDLSAAVFFDAGNVVDGFFSSVYPASTTRLFHPTVGAGLRYLTPVGPVRFDVGVPLQTDVRLADLPPVAFQLTLGEAY
ncbi:MAG: BamA/TamA family outer membrane protein [Deltaproteobacteria bacterium]|nr:BamA/TamA family outer membrane protein [Deltaproteobacteria bacterium]